MTGGHHQCNEHELGQTLGYGERQGALACCSSWGPRVRLNWATEQHLLHLHECVHARLAAKSCLIISDSVDCGPPGSSVHGTLQARILEWIRISSPRGSSQPRDQAHVSCTGRGFFTTEPPGKPLASPCSPH